MSSNNSSTSTSNNNSLKMVEANLPPGFRFHPKDEELVCDYLMMKLTPSSHHHHHHHHLPTLVEVDLNKSEPWDIPETACVGGKEWYFYSQRDRKYATGLRTNRATISGYWKATGKDRQVMSNRRGSGGGGGLVGMRKTLVFYRGRAPKGKKTDWVMHEFRLHPPDQANSSTNSKEDWVLCRVFHKNKDVPRTAKQAGMGNEYHYEEASSLPPLTMDDHNPPYIMSLDYHDHITSSHHQQEYHHEQVPCFSNNIFKYTNLQTTNSQTFSSNSNCHHMITTKHMEQPNMSSKLTSPTFENTNINPSTFIFNKKHYYLPPKTSSCENHMVIDSAPNHLTKTDDNANYKHYVLPSAASNMIMINDSPTSFGEAASTSESFLSEVGFSTIWNQY